jgi:hypothetical protein
MFITLIWTGKVWQQDGTGYEKGHDSSSEKI